MHLYKLIFVLRFFTHFYVVLLSEQMNVGTVLFTKKDAARSCWNQEQLALLRARLIYQDILPKTSLVDLKSDDVLTALLDYFRLAIGRVKRLPEGPTQQINLRAMCDVVGGYFRCILLPLTKRAFYGASIKYETAEKALKFYNNVKLFLHTDGLNWAPPSDAIDVRFERRCAPQSRCTEEEAGEAPCDESCGKLTFTEAHGFIDIPIPHLDSQRAPSIVVTAFKECPLRSLQEKNCIAMFYATATACLRAKRAYAPNIRAFNEDFEKFLDDEVYPHLTDETIYGAFGGLYPIKNELNCKNVEKRTNLEEHANLTKTARKADNKVSKDKGQSLFEDDDDKAPIIVLVCLCLVTALWLCITLYYCARNRQTKAPQASPPSEKRRKSSSLKIAEGAKRPSAGSTSKSVQVRDSITKADDSRLTFVVKGDSDEVRPETCPKCKRRNCRCFTNIWRTLSRYTVTYPRIFPKKNTATSGLLQKHVGDESGGRTAVSLCPQCKTAQCKHLAAISGKSEHKAPAQTHFLVQMAPIVPKSGARTAKSAPVTAGKHTWQSEKTSRTATRPESRRTDDKLFVFGYDFETSSSDDSSFTDETSSDTN